MGPYVTDWFNTTVYASLSPSSSPPPLLGASMAYDPPNSAEGSVNGTVVMFGGLAPWGATNDTYVGIPSLVPLPDGLPTESVVWVNITPYLLHAPSPRYYAAMTYDAHDGVLLLFGGESAGINASLSDTWTLSVVYQGEIVNPPPQPVTYRFLLFGWSVVAGGNHPLPRAGAALTYDPVDGYPVLFGGYDDPTFYGDTWYYTAGNWVQLHPAPSPYPRGFAGFVWDAALGYGLLLPGLGGSTDTWAYVHGAWNRLNNSTSLGGRWDESAVYDNSTGNATVFGGVNSTTSATYADTWNWSTPPPAWKEVDSYGPSARAAAAMAYDPQIGCSVLFGGATTGVGGWTNDTWLLCTWPVSVAPFLVTLVAHPGISDRPETRPGGNATFTATPAGGTWPYVYEFNLSDGPGSPASEVVEVLDGPANVTFSFPGPANYLVSVWVEDNNGEQARANLTYPVGTLMVVNWQPLRDFYSFGNYKSGWASGNCFGFATTALLYWAHDIQGIAATPYLPSSTYSTYTLHEPPGISPYPGPGLNGTTLAILMHQTLDPSNTVNVSFNGSAMAASYTKLQHQLSLGHPVLLALYAPGVGYHAVVAYGEWTEPNGTVEIATSDSNDAGATNLGTWDPVNATFSLYSGGAHVTGFASDLPVQAVSTVQPSWLGKWPYTSYSQEYDTQGFGWELVASNATLDITSSAGGNDSFALPSNGDSQTLSGTINGSSGIEEPYQSGVVHGVVQAYSLPLATGVTYTVHDPANGTSALSVLRAVNISGTPTVRGLSLGVTSPNLHALSVTAGPNGSDWQVGNQSVAVNLSLAQLIGNSSDVLNASYLDLPAFSDVALRVTNWSALGSVSSPTVTVEVTTANGSGPTSRYSLENGQTGLGTGTVLSQPVSFHELNLPAGTPWSVTVGNSTVHGSTATLGFNATNGSYAYTARSANASWSAPAGSFAVAGAPISVTVSFRLVTYSVNWTEVGLPLTVLASHGWTVAFAGAPLHANLPTLGVSAPNGTYPVVVSASAGYVTVAGPVAAVTVAGASLNETVHFVRGPTKVLSFVERGLPPGQLWSVELNGWVLSSSRPAIRFLNLTPGNYSYSVVSPRLGQTITAKLATAPVPLSGVIDLTRSEAIRLTFVYPYAVTFSETGLASGSWSITVRGVTETAAAGAVIVFEVKNGTYGFLIGVETGLAASATPRPLVVSGAAMAVRVAFSVRS